MLDWKKSYIFKDWIVKEFDDRMIWTQHEDLLKIDELEYLNKNITWFKAKKIHNVDELLLESGRYMKRCYRTIEYFL